jgi:hypothetical protein
MDPPSDYCKTVMRCARQTQELAVKKMLWLTLLCMSKDMQDYYGSHSDYRKFIPFMKHLRPSLEKFTKGVHRDGFSKCKSAIDSAYPSVVAFVAEMAALYVNL